MKILIVSQYFWPEHFGINRQVHDLIGLGAEVTVLTGRPNYPNGQIFPGYRGGKVLFEKVAGADVVRVPLLARGKGSGLRLALNYLSFVFFGVIFGVCALRGRTFDRIFVYAPSPILQAIPALVLSRLKQAPIAVWVQDLWPQSLAATGHVRNRVVLFLVDRVVRWIYRSTDLLLVQSKSFVDPVQIQAGAGAIVRYFPNSTDAPDLFIKPSRDPAIAKWVDEIKNHFSIVFTGNVGTAQAMESVLDAAQFCCDNPNIRFFVVGSGSVSDWLAIEVEKRGLKNFILTGRLPPESMPEIWSVSSALLITLKNEPIFSLTVPNKLQCYLAAGKPVVASIGGEGARIVEEACAGLTCPPSDGFALANVIKQMAQMTPTELLKLGRNGRSYFLQNFEPQMLSRSLISLLDELGRKNSTNSK